MYKCNCYAKVNLYLDVLEKRKDGFHEIISLFQTISLHDSIFLDFVTGSTADVVFKSNDPSLDWSEKNSIFVAFQEFQKKFGKINKKLFIYLKKRIPKACGFGGESTDAAGMLLILAKINDLETKNILDIAEKVGSDVKFFLFGGTAIVTGKGERIKKLEPLKNLSVDLRIPDFHLKTPEMYRLLDENWEKLIRKGDPLKLYEALKNFNERKIQQNLFNIFEQVAILKHPSLLHYKDSKFSSMTGSGPAFYTIRSDGSGRYTFITGANRVEEIGETVENMVSYKRYR